MFWVRHCVPLTVSDSGVFPGKSVSETKNKWSKIPVSFAFVKEVCKEPLLKTQKSYRKFLQNQANENVQNPCLNLTETTKIIGIFGHFQKYWSFLTLLAYSDGSIHTFQKCIQNRPYFYLSGTLKMNSST